MLQKYSIPSDEELAQIMSETDDFDSLKGFTHLFLPPVELALLGTGSIVSTELKQKMRESLSDDVIERYFGIPFERYNLVTLKIFWVNISIGNITHEDEFFVMRDGEKILLSPVWDELTRSTMFVWKQDNP